jgi:hypothetical protein
VSLCCQVFFVILLIPSFWWEVVWNHNTTQQVFLILHCRTYEWLLFEWLAERLLCLCYGFWSSFLITNTDVYERLVPKGSKAGFAQLLSTQVTSAVWHVCSLSHELWIMNPFHLPLVLFAREWHDIYRENMFVQIVPLICREVMLW